MSWLQAERWRLLRNWICKNGTKLKLKFIDGGFNLNYVKIYKKGTKAPIAKSDDLTKA